MNDEETERLLIARPQQGLTVQAPATAARGVAALEARPKPKEGRVQQLMRAAKILGAMREAKHATKH